MTSSAPRLSLVLKQADQAAHNLSVDPFGPEREVHIHLHLGSPSVGGALPQSVGQPAPANPSRRSLRWPGVAVAGTALLMLGYVVGGYGAAPNPLPSDPRRVWSAPVPPSFPRPPLASYDVPSLPPASLDDSAVLQRDLAQRPTVALPAHAPSVATQPAGKNPFGLDN